ncbi:MAG: bacillithiol biosynthesis BshC, partial [Saprospiraceae bacterium]|nr:bacillithiol biosynthesis BshC [Saprospiraceae bacterium]
MLELEVSRIPFNDVPQFSKTDTDYATHPERFRKWIEYLPEYASFDAIIRRRQDADVQRDLLVDVLEKQYQAIDEPTDHLGILRQPGQFTITTAHQPVLLTGPLYFIYKVCSAIHLADKLDQRYPDWGVHPVLVLGGEDHDFDEVNHLHLFGKSFTWESGQTGAVGRMQTDDLLPVLETVREVLGSSPFAGELAEMISQAFRPGRPYGQAMQKFVISLFRHTRLIVLQMDEKALKGAFAPVIREELFDTVSHALISETQSALEAAGYKPQAYLRDINLFYLHEGMRSRIVREESGYFKV